MGSGNILFPESRWYSRTVVRNWFLRLETFQAHFLVWCFFIRVFASYTAVWSYDT